jgi:hypothetical protein
MRDARRGARRQEQQDKTGGKVQRIKSARASEYSLAGDSVVVVAKLVAIRHSFGSHLDDGGCGGGCAPAVGVAIAKIDQTKRRESSQEDKKQAATRSDRRRRALSTDKSRARAVS